MISRLHYTQIFNFHNFFSDDFPITLTRECLKDFCKSLVWVQGLLYAVEKKKDLENIWSGILI